MRTVQIRQLTMFIGSKTGALVKNYRTLAKVAVCLLLYLEKDWVLLPVTRTVRLIAWLDTVKPFRQEYHDKIYHVLYDILLPLKQGYKENRNFKVIVV